MSAPKHTVEDFGQPEYLDGASMQFALADENGRRSAYVGRRDHATLYAAAPELLQMAIESRAVLRAVRAETTDPTALRVLATKIAKLDAAIAKATGQ